MAPRGGGQHERVQLEKRYGDADGAMCEGQLLRRPPALEPAPPKAGAAVAWRQFLRPFAGVIAVPKWPPDQRFRHGTEGKAPR